MDNQEITKIARYQKIGSLNLFKFALAFLTFLFHWRLSFSVVYKNELIDNFIHVGHVAMNGFFILSGFLLYYIYSKKDFFNSDYLKNFYLKRLIKILPSCYFITVVMYFLKFFIVHEQTSWVAVLMQILLFQAYFPELFGLFLNGGLWFISVLVFLYFLFPLLCFITRSVKNLPLFAISVYLLGIFPLIVDCYYYNGALYFLPYFRICEFVMGMITARFFINSKINLKNGGLYLIMTMLAIFFSVSILYKNNFINHTPFGSRSIYYDVVLLILYPLLIWFLSKTKTKYFLKITENRLSDYLGKIAYSFFITQIICMFLIKNIFMPKDYFGMSSTCMLAVSFVMNLVLAIILYELFEKKVSNALIKIFIKN